MNLKNRKAALFFISLSLLGIIVLYFSGCSGKNSLIMWGKTGGPEGNSDLSTFIPTIRPVPGTPDSHYLLAGYYQQRGQHREAVAEFKKVVSIDPKYVKAYNGLGISYDLLGEFPNAITSYETGLALDPGQAYLHNNLGYSYLIQGNPHGAISAFQKAISLSPGELLFHNNLASAYAEKAQYDLALDEFRHGGNEAQAHYNMAEIYLHKGMYAEAKNHYAAALRLDASETLVRTGGKAADTLTSLLGKIQKNFNLQTGTVLSPKIEDMKAEREVSVATEMNLPVESQVAQTAASVDPDPIKPGAPVIRAARSAQFVRDQEHDRNATADSHAAGLEKGKNGNGMGEWNYEMKMALLQGKAVPFQLEAPVSDQKTVVAAMKKEIPRNIGIEVSNGNGVTRMAKRVGHYLSENGYPVVRLTNSKPFNRPHTQIYYREGNREIAYLSAKQLPTCGDLIELKELDRPSIQVKILLGKDIVPHNANFREEEGS